MNPRKAERSESYPGAGAFLTMAKVVYFRGQNTVHIFSKAFLKSTKEVS